MKIKQKEKKWRQNDLSMRRRFEEPWQNLRVQEDLKKLYSFNKHCNVKLLSFVRFFAVFKNTYFLQD